MKPRTVIITLEVVTSNPILELRDKDYWIEKFFYTDFEVKQVYVNVIKNSKTKWVKKGEKVK